jgi:hypothetical protein
MADLAEIVDYLKGLLSPPPAEAAAAPAVAEDAPPPDADTGEIDQARFEAQVRRLVAGRAEGVEICLHFIGFRRAADRVTDRSQLPEESIRRRVLLGFSRTTGMEDAYAAYGDRGYLVTLGAQAVLRARLKCGLVARDISRCLTGAVDTDLMDIVSVAVAGDGQIVTDWSQPYPPPPLPKPEPPPAPAAKAKPVAKPGGSVLAKGVASTATTSTAKGKGAPADAPKGKEPEKDKPAMSDAKGPPPPPPPPPSFGPQLPTYKGGRGTPFVYDEHAQRFVELEEFQFVYRPVWQIKNRIVFSHLCSPARLAKDGSVLIGGRAMPMPFASVENAALDILALKKAVDDLKALYEQGRRLVFILPVHHVTLNESRTNKAFLEVCNYIREDLRKLLIFEVIGLPPVLPYTILVRIFSSIRPFSRAILLRRRMDSEVTANLREMGVYGVGVDIGNYNAPEAQIISEMNRFNDHVRPTGFATYCHGANTISLISSAVGAGFSMIAGDAVLSMIDTPQVPSPFDLVSLYQTV